MAVVKGGVQAPAAFSQIPASGFLSGQTLPVNLSAVVQFANGLLTDQIDLVGVKSFSFSGTTPITVDLTAMVDVLGGAVNLARVKLLVFVFQSVTDAQTVTITSGASTGWDRAFSSITARASTANNPAGGFIVLSSPGTTSWAVDSTHKAIDFTPTATSTGLMVAAGCSA